MKSKRPEKRGILSHHDEGWSLPYMWILIVILFALHLVFGWVVWPIAVGFVLVVALIVTIYDAMISRNGK